MTIGELAEAVGGMTAADVLAGAAAFLPVAD